jgi:phosphohistidine phosphatase
MRLYLVQHGQAKSESEDPERRLTSQGLEAVTRVARHSVELFSVRVARVVHSGKTRARQTAEIWSRLCGVDVEQAGDLAPNDDPAIWAERLNVEQDDLMLVGHLPHLARLTGLLLVGTAEHSVVGFQQGGLVGLDQTETGWAVWLVVPPELV